MSGILPLHRQGLFTAVARWVSSAGRSRRREHLLCAIFAAVSSSACRAATIGMIAIEMERRGFAPASSSAARRGRRARHPDPASIPVIIYGVMTETSVDHPMARASSW
jgi:TRAP-type C4-dicarboxylate transport system permease large subunit